MVTKSKTRIEIHKDKVHTALNDLEYAVNNCSKEVPRTVGRAMNALKEASDDNVLYAEEYNAYRRRISDLVERFEKGCSCNQR